MMENTNNPRAVDYDSVASTFAKRYELRDYSGIEQAVAAFIATAARARALEVGCGTGYWLDKIAWWASAAVGIDPSRGMLRQAGPGAVGDRLVQARAEALPFPSNCFDRIVCINSFHHFTDKLEFLRQAETVLTSGGGLIVVGLDPHQEGQRWWIYDYFPPALDIDLERFLPSQKIRELMDRCGLENCTTREVHRMSHRIDGAELRAEPNWISKTSTSQLTALTEGEYADGLEQLQRDLRAGENGGDVFRLAVDLRFYATVGWVD